VNKKIKVVSLFSGIGGFEKGLEKSKIDYEIVFASEIDRFARETYGCNFSLKNMVGDIKKVNEKDIPNHELLCAGFPCQSFSVAGKRKGFKDIRGTLFFDIVRIIKEKKPKYILLENVKNLISHDNGNTIKTIIRDISDCGYTFDITVINSREAGLPQNRERTYIVGVLDYKIEKFKLDIRNQKINEIKSWANDIGLKSMNFFNNVLFEQTSLHISDILDTDIEEKYYINSDKVRKFIDGLDKRKFKKGFDNNIIKEFDLPREVHNDLERQRRVYSINGISPTLLARSDSPKILTNIKGHYRIRKLTPCENFKIQGFDEPFVNNIKLKGISDTQLYKQSGNAVSPPVITQIINSIKEQLNEKI
jgi:DNA (cytosine-5)-methyltransferase 1